MMQPGDKVHWTHVRQQGREVSLERRDGTIETIDGKDAVVRSGSNRRTRVALARLRLDGQPGQIDELIEAARGANRGPA